MNTTGKREDYEKMKMVIYCDHGRVDAVFTEKPYPFNVVVIDTDDEDDPERAQNYQDYMEQIGAGLFYDVMNVDTPADDKAYDDKILSPDDRALALIRNPAETEIGFMMQKIYTAYIDGYLTAYGILNRYILNLYRSKDPDVAGKAEGINALFKPLRDKFHKYYDDMVEHLNNNDIDAEV